MLIPDCRNDIHYNEDFLNKDDKQYIAGFDSCTDAMEIAIAAIETANFYLDELFEDDSETLASVLEKELTVDVKKRISDEYGTECETYADVLLCELFQYIEMERDELITSMIDGMQEDEYEKNRKEALKRNEESENPKEYYDTRKLYNTENGGDDV